MGAIRATSGAGVGQWADMPARHRPRVRSFPSTFHMVAPRRRVWKIASARAWRHLTNAGAVVALAATLLAGWGRKAQAGGG